MYFGSKTKLQCFVGCQNCSKRCKLSYTKAKPSDSLAAHNGNGKSSQFRNKIGVLLILSFGPIKLFTFTKLLCSYN